MVNDPIADFIVQLKNAGAAGRFNIAVPYSKLKYAVAEKLVACGYLKGATKRGKKARKALEVELNVHSGKASIAGVERVSKPGRRMYTSAARILPVRQGKGVLVLSTPKGILTDREARKEHVGGEILFKIW
jgi:small subunit ribosomal protein S8